MARRKRIAPPDAVACIPLACYGVLLVLAVLLSALGVWDAAGSHTREWDATIAGVRLPFIAFFGAILIAAPLSFLAAGATGFHTLLVMLDDLADGRWTLAAQKRRLGRAVLSGVGFLLCWAQLGKMLSVAID